MDELDPIHLSQRFRKLLIETNFDQVADSTYYEWACSDPIGKPIIAFLCDNISEANIITQEQLELFSSFKNGDLEDPSSFSIDKNNFIEDELSTSFDCTICLLERNIKTLEKRYKDLFEVTEKYKRLHSELEVEVHAKFLEATAANNKFDETMHNLLKTVERFSELHVTHEYTEDLDLYLLSEKDNLAVLEEYKNDMFLTNEISEKTSLDSLFLPSEKSCQCSNISSTSQRFYDLQAKQLDLLCFRHAAAEKILLQKQEQLVILSVLKEELSRFSCSTKDLDPLFKNFTIEGFPESKKHLKILYNQQKELFPLLSLPYVVADQQLKLDYQIKVKAAVEVLLSALKRRLAREQLLRLFLHSEFHSVQTIERYLRGLVQSLTAWHEALVKRMDSINSFHFARNSSFFDSEVLESDLGQLVETVAVDLDMTENVRSSIIDLETRHALSSSVLPVKEAVSLYKTETNSFSIVPHTLHVNLRRAQELLASLERHICALQQSTTRFQKNQELNQLKAFYLHPDFNVSSPIPRF